MDATAKISGDTVRDDFNHIRTVIHYTKAAHELGLWASERLLIERYLPDREAPLLEAGCGAGRVALGLWRLGYRRIGGFDFASELVEQAENLAAERHATSVEFLQADATRLPGCSSDDAPTRTVPEAGPVPPPLAGAAAYAGVLFLFNGLMQIPGRENRRAAMRGLRRLCRPDGYFVFTSHDREDPAEASAWREEAARWAAGRQDPRLVEFGDRYFAHEDGHTFMHLPDRGEVLADLVATGWRLERTATRDELAVESAAVRQFSDNCRFWVARR